MLVHLISFSPSKNNHALILTNYFFTLIIILKLLKRLNPFMEDLKMSRKKITIKDVARQAGVSTATVSYIVNNRTDIKITEETRKKVLQVVNLLNYSPNQAAQALAANRKSLLATYLPATDTLLQNAENLNILKTLTNYFHQKKYEMIILNDLDLEKCDQADAIICYNTDSETFHKLGNNNFIPLLAVDCMITDPLFFQINSDPNRLKEAADRFFHGEDYSFVMLVTPNKPREQFLQTAFPKMTFVSTPQECNAISGKNILTCDHTLYELLKEKNEVCYVPSLDEQKLSTIHTCMEEALARTPLDQHDVLV